MFEDRRVKISVTFKKDIVEKLDMKAMKAGLSRSRYCENLIKADVEA